ncbi:MAG TPA: molybdopterin-dependent oxidoreductase, partial [Bryobacteraceae bacterium]|nr:molybdopterin-dependent oxidoreductase [Bryobacteraceae bacterium]
MRRALSLSGLLAFLPEFEVPAAAQGETDIPFTDYPANFNPNPNPDAATRFLDIRKIDGHITPTDQFFFIQHYNRPEIDPLTYKLKFTGMVTKPQELLLSDLKAMKPVIDVVNGYECSGNSAARFQGLSSCGKFTGVRLRDVLK